MKKHTWKVFAFSLAVFASAAIPAAMITEQESAPISRVPVSRSKKVEQPIKEIAIDATKLRSPEFIAENIRYPSELDGDLQDNVRLENWESPLRLTYQPPVSPDYVVSRVEELRDQVERLTLEKKAIQKENDRLRAQVSNMRTELLVCNPSYVPGPVSNWIEQAQEGSKPTPGQIRIVSDILNDYPVKLTPQEADWIAERYERKDWTDFGADFDEAVIQFLGARRIATEVPKQDLDRLRAEWSEEGYFGR